MKKLFSALLTAALIFGCCGCTNMVSWGDRFYFDVSGSGESRGGAKKENYSYKFEPCDPGLLPLPREKLRGVYDGRPAEKHSLFIGQALALFGSDYFTDNNEDMYSKAVSAEDSDGNVIYFEVYYGPSDPAIGGDYGDDDKERVLAAADELAEYIMAAQPADFERQSVYEDFDITLIMGVKDGVPYYNTVFPDEFVG